ncbi:33417_t:CDS:1, partial [Gigaspora margarita]
MPKTSKIHYEEILIQDFIKFFEEDSNYDLEIKVGEEPNVKIFRGRSQIFIARSSYLNLHLLENGLKKIM